CRSSRARIRSAHCWRSATDMAAGTLSSSTPSTTRADTVRWRWGEATMRIGGDHGWSLAFAAPLVMGRRSDSTTAAADAGEQGVPGAPVPLAVGYDPAMLVFAAIVPHATHAVLDGEPPGAETRSAMAELSSRFDAAQPDAVIVLTPHTVHVEGAMAVVT